jgi:hypothetical protein
VADAGVIDSKTPEAIDVFAAEKIFHDGAFAGPFECGKVLGLGHRFSVGQEAPVVKIFKVFQCMPDEKVFGFSVEFFSTRDQMPIVSGLDQDLCRIGSGAGVTALFEILGKAGADLEFAKFSHFAPSYSGTERTCTVRAVPAFDMGPKWLPTYFCKRLHPALLCQFSLCHDGSQIRGLDGILLFSSL